MLKAVMIASFAKMTPLSNPLLRTVVASAIETLDKSINTSLFQGLFIHKVLLA
jgi:hypothetical protein